MKIISTILFFLIFTGITFAKAPFTSEQQRKIDSLNTLIEQNHSDTLVASAYLELSEVLYLSNFDTVISLCNEALRIADDNLKNQLSKSEKRSFLITIAGAYNNIGYVYDDKGAIVLALKYYHQSLKIREKVKDYQGIAESLNNIGIIYVDQGEEKKALGYYLKSLEVKEPLGDKKSIAISLNNIGVIYRNLGNYKTALKYYHNSLELRQEIKDERGIGISLSNIGTIYSKLDSLDVALNFYERALAIRQKIGDKPGETSMLTNIADIKFKKGELKIAKQYALKAFESSKELGYSTRIRDAANLLCKLYKKEKDWENAFKMQQLYVLMKDSIRNKETEFSAIKQEAKYKLEKVEKEKELLEKEKDIQTLENNRNQIIGWFLIIAFILLLVLMIITYRSNRKKHIINNLLEKQKNEAQQQYELKNAMLKEIHHRVKNNLQVVNSLLNLQANEIEDDRVLSMISDTQNRVISMARLHEQMYNSDDLETIDIKEHFTNLITELIKDYNIDTDIKLDVNVDVNNDEIGIRTLVPLGLVINEMISNSLKHAFKDRTEGIIFFHLKHIDGIKCEMLIGDNGIGMKKDVNIEESTSLGLQLVSIFIEQMNGVIEREGVEGSMFKVIFENIDKLKK